MSGSTVSGVRTSPIFDYRESKEARTQLDAFADGNSRFDSVWIGVTWLIRRNPYNAGRLLPGWTDIFVLKTDDFLKIGMPIIFVYYKIIDVPGRLMEITRVNLDTP